jgi:1-deoxy-D-xylulose-5-phosphate synthase
MTLVTYGVNVNDALEAAENLKKENVSLEVLKLGVINPLPLEPVLASVKKTGRLLVVEECVAQNCVGQRIAAALICGGIPAGSVRLLNLGDRYVTHGTSSSSGSCAHRRGRGAAGVMEELGNG